MEMSLFTYFFPGSNIPGRRKLLRGDFRLLYESLGGTFFWAGYMNAEQIPAVFVGRTTLQWGWRPCGVKGRRSGPAFLRGNWELCPIVLNPSSISKDALQSRGSNV